MKTKAIAFATIAIFSYLNISASEPAGETAGTGSQPTESAEGRTAETEDQHAESMAANSDALPNDSTVVSLDDLIVVETRKLVQSDGAKLTYNVSEDPEAGSSNILDILRKVPGVSVDAQDNVKVNGQSSFKILKNGHEDVMFKGDIKTILKSLPANSIKKIEVISEPGAKYDAEGVGGILNIVTDNSARLSGFMTQASVWANSYNLGGNLRGMVKLNKVMLDANATYNNGKIWSRKQTGNSTNEYEDGGSRRVLTGDATSRPSWEYGAANVNLSWEPDTLNLFTFSANVYANGWDPVSREKRVMTDGDGVTIWSLDRRVESRGTSRGLNLQASYQHNFGRDDNSLVFSYLYGHDKEDQNQYSIIEESEGYTSAGTAFELPYFHTVSDSRENSHIIQVDYSNEFDDHHRFEAGLKGSLNHTSAQDSENSGATQEDALPVAGTAIDLRQFRDIYALYATYSGNFSRFAVTAGTRYEYTRMGMRYRVGDHPDFTTLLHDLVPNAAVSYKFTDTSNLRLAYQMRIGRPGIWVLNPFVDRLLPGEITYGNPNLKSEKAHNVSLSYSNYGGKFGGTAKFTYRHVANSITDVIFMKDGIENSTYANIGRDDRFSIELNGDWTIVSGLRWSFYGCASYINLSAKSELIDRRRDGWKFDCNTNINYTLPCKLRLSAYGGCYTRWFDLQSEGRDGYFYGFGASRSFLKEDALSLSLSVSNPFPPKRKTGYTQEGEGVTAKVTNTYSQWNVGLQITYRFGGLKASVKQTAASIDDDGVSGQGGNKKN